MAIQLGPLVAKISAAIPGIAKALTGAVGAGIDTANSTIGVAKTGFNIGKQVLNAVNMIDIPFRLLPNFGEASKGYDSFASDISNKFLVSGLKLTTLRGTIDEINSSFNKAMDEQGLRTSSENVAIQQKASILFAVLKGGSINAAVAMSENIRRGLGEVSKQVGSSTADINQTMNLIPLMSRKTLDSMGITMDDLAGKALKLTTNTRVALGEDSANFLYKALSGKVSQSEMRNDPSGIGQLINRMVGGVPLDAISPAQRTRVVANLLNNQNFQNQLEELAERSGGFQLVFKRFTNTLFDSETGIFGVLKEVSVDLADFSGKVSGQTTSVFGEIKRIISVIFDTKTGIFALIAQSISEVFGIDADSPLKLVVQVLRFISNFLNDLRGFFVSDTFKSVLEGIKYISSAISETARIIWGLITTGLIPAEDVAKIQAGLNAFVSGLTSEILPFLTNFVNSLGNHVQKILKSLTDLFGTLTFDGDSILKGLVGLGTALMTQISIILPQLFNFIVVAFKSIVANFGGGGNIKLHLLEFLRAFNDAVVIVLGSLNTMIINPLRAFAQSPAFAALFKDIGITIAPALCAILHTITNYFLLKRDVIVAAITNLFNDKLTRCLVDNLVLITDGIVDILFRLFKFIIANVVPSITQAITWRIKNGSAPPWTTQSGSQPGSAQPGQQSWMPPGSTQPGQPSGMPPGPNEEEDDGIGSKFSKYILPRVAIPGFFAMKRFLPGAIGRITQAALEYTKLAKRLGAQRALKYAPAKVLKALGKSTPLLAGAVEFALNAAGGDPLWWNLIKTGGVTAASLAPIPGSGFAASLALEGVGKAFGFENKASGNFIDVVQREQSQSPASARPVIANTDEMIIPRGRVHELNDGIEQSVLTSLAPRFDQVHYSLRNIFALSDTADSSTSLKTKKFEDNINSIVFSVVEILKETTNNNNVLKDVKKSTELSNLIGKRSQASPPPPVLVPSPPTINLPEISQEKFAETIVKATERKEQSFWDKLKGLVGLGARRTPEPPTVVSAPSVPRTTKSTNSTDLSPIQIRLELDGQILTDVVLTEIEGRRKLLNTTP
jgi:hypothetical protein